MSPLRLVLVDDNREFRDVLSMLLPRRFDVTVEHAFADAESALEHLRERPVDVVLVDYRMPGMNGIEFIRHVRALESSPKVFLVSFNPLPALRDAAMEAGATAVLAKTSVERELASHLPPRGDT